MKNFNSIYVYDDSASTYVDLEFASIDVPGTSLALLEETTDRIYMGLDRTFSGAYFDLTTTGIGYSNPLDWEYWNGTVWRNLPIQTNYAFTEDGVVQFVIPADWTTRTLDGVEVADTGLQTEDDTGGTARYWIRVASTSAATTVATLRRTFPFPSYAYTTPAEILSFMQLRFAAFTSSTNPTLTAVEQMIQRIEGRIESFTSTAWKPKYREEDFHNFNRIGFTLKRYPVIQAFEVAMYNGGEFEVLSEGREGDYFIDNTTGIFSFARLVSLPFSYSRVRAYGFAANRRSVRIKYIWGRDIDFDDYAFTAKDVATKLVAADILSNYDWSPLITQGSDRFSIDEKIRGWKEDAEERMAEIRSVKMWVP